jgi:uncharacterized protein YbcI
MLVPEVRSAMPDRTPVPQQALSDEIARLYKSRYGRGPTKITVQLAPGVVICVLEDVNTAAQQALVELGAIDVAQATHLRLQMGMADEMSQAVEATTGRRVRGYIPGFNSEIAAATDTFLLEPEGA